jgi:hypothetical protein
MLLLLVVAVAFAASVAPASADHGTLDDCTGAGDFCIPSGVGSVVFFKDTGDCRFDASISWGDGASENVADFQDGQRVDHTYTTHDVFQVSLDTSATPLVEGAVCNPQDSSWTYEVPPPIVVTPNFTATAGTGSGKNRPFSFNASSTSKEPPDVVLTYQWDFGDGTTGTGVAPSHTYSCNPAGDKLVTVSLSVIAKRGDAQKLVAFANQISVRKCDPQCSDLADNDGDGRTDHPSDRGCTDKTDDSESPDPVIGGPEQNACLRANVYGAGPDERRRYDALEQQWRALAEGLKQSAQHLDLFWYLEQVENSGLTQRIGDVLTKAERLLRVAEQNARAADARVRTTQGFLDEVNRALRAEGTKTPRGRAFLAEKQRLTRELNERKRAQAQASKALDELKRSRLGDLAVKLGRRPELKQLANTLKQLDKLRRQAGDFLKRNPAAKNIFRFLNRANLASELTTYGAWAAELIANQYREWRRPPEGCQQFFEPPPTSVEPSAASLARSSARSKYLPGVIPSAQLPPAITGGKLPPAAWKLRSRLAELSVLVPAVGSALRDSDRSAARAAVKQTLPRLRSLIVGMRSLRIGAAKALKIRSRKVTAKQLAGYRPQPPSRNALALLREGGAPRALRTDFGSLFKKKRLASGRLDPLAALTRPEFSQLEAQLAETLQDLR